MTNWISGEGRSCNAALCIYFFFKFIYIKYIYIFALHVHVQRQVHAGGVTSMQLTLKTILMHFNSMEVEVETRPSIGAVVSCCLLIYGILNAIYCLCRQVLSTRYSGLWP